MDDLRYALPPHHQDRITTAMLDQMTWHEMDSRRMTSNEPE